MWNFWTREIMGSKAAWVMPDNLFFCFAFRLMLLNTAQIPGTYHWLVVEQGKQSTDPHLENRRWTLAVWQPRAHTCTCPQHACKPASCAKKSLETLTRPVQLHCSSCPRNSLGLQPAALFSSPMGWGTACTAVAVPDHLLSCSPKPLLMLSLIWGWNIGNLMTKNHGIIKFGKHHQVQPSSTMFSIKPCP